MKKLIAGLFVAILTTAGLVAVTSSVPAAADCRRGYDCEQTSVKKPPAQNNVKAGKKPKPVKVDVQTRGNVKAKGTVVVTIKGPGGYSKKITVKYNGKAVNVKIPALKKAGTYKVTVDFQSADGFRDSKTTSTIKVKKK